jgi:hypothetical protein
MSAKLEFLQALKKINFDRSDLKKFGQEIINMSSAPDMVKDTSIIAGILMKIKKDKANKTIIKYSQVADLFHSFFWEELKGDFSLFQAQRKGIELILDIL